MLALEVYIIMAGINIGIVIWETLNIITRKLKITLIPVVICTNSRSLFEYLLKLGITSKKHPMIDVMALREAYERMEIKEFR